MVSRSGSGLPGRARSNTPGDGTARPGVDAAGHGPPRTLPARRWGPCAASGRSRSPGTPPTRRRRSAPRTPGSRWARCAAGWTTQPFAGRRPRQRPAGRGGRADHRQPGAGGGRLRHRRPPDDRPRRGQHRQRLEPPGTARGPRRAALRDGQGRRRGAHPGRRRRPRTGRRPGEHRGARLGGDRAAHGVPRRPPAGATHRRRGPAGRAAPARPDRPPGGRGRGRALPAVGRRRLDQRRRPPGGRRPRRPWRRPRGAPSRLRTAARSRGPRAGRRRRRGTGCPARRRRSGGRTTAPAASPAGP